MEKKINSEILIKHLQTKWKGQKCQMCCEGNWNISDTIFELREYNQGSLVIGGGPIIPVIPITCDNCGNTILINAIKAGVIEIKKNK